MIVGAIIRGKRKELGLSIRELSESSGVSDRTLIYIENGMSPNISTLEKVLEPLNMEVVIREK